MNFSKFKFRVPQGAINLTFLLIVAVALIASNQKDDHIKNSTRNAGTDPYLGEIAIYPYNFTPRGWMECDGRLLQISQHTALFSLLGTMYGGDGRTNFALPDLRGRTVIGHGTGAGLTQRIVGQKGGSETVTVTSNQLPATSVNASADMKLQYGTTQVAAASQGSSTAIDVISSIGSGGGQAPVTGNVTLGGSGGNQPVNNMQPYAVMGYYIAVVGTFPSRN